MVTVSKELQDMYDTQYSDSSEEWRRIGAIGKVQNIIDVTKGLKLNKIVEIGAGDGNILSLLNEKKYCKDMVAVEISSSAIEQIKKKNIDAISEIRQFDGYDLPFKDKEFDLAICSHVMEHVEHPRILLNEIRRISKKQVFEIPCDFSFGVDKKYKHYYSYGHINIFTPGLFNFLLYSQGFEILRAKHAFYKKELIDFQYKKVTLGYILNMIKRVIWRLIPVLMRTKPQTYTVLTE